ncbi:MAG: hypothetical protein ABIN01_00180 [Ferruginibacter sp.]
MKKFLFLLLVLVQFVFLTSTYSQNIAINGTGNQPDTSAMLDISSTTKGFLAPRMTTTQQNAIPLPATGLLIFNTTDNAFKVNTGTTVSPVWSLLAGAALSLTTTGTSGAATYSSSTGVLNIPAYATTGWLITGNTGITQPAAPATYGTSVLGASENFLGTKDLKDLVLATNNLERIRVTSGGYLGIGTATPSKPIDLVKNLPGGGLVKLQNTSTTGYSSIDIWSDVAQIGNIGYANAGGTYGNSFYFATNTSTAPMVLATNNSEKIRILASATTTDVNVGIGTQTPTAVLQLKGGTAAASTAPFKIEDGIVLSTIEEGTIEKDANVFYITPDATNRGVLPAVSYTVLSSDNSLSNVTSAQAVFPSGQGTINLAAATTYEFEAQYKLTTGATSHTTSTLFTASTALTSISYIAQLSSGAANTITTTVSTRNVISAAAAALNATSTNVETIIQLKGVLRTNSACTFIPKIQFSAGPGAGANTNKCLDGSYLKLTPIGTNSMIKVGSWF